MVGMFSKFWARDQKQFVLILYFHTITPVGVCQLVNKMEEGSSCVKAFNRNDEQFLEAFAIFCGLGIQNTQMYETVERAMAKQEVTLEVRPANKIYNHSTDQE